MSLEPFTSKISIITFGIGRFQDMHRVGNYQVYFEINLQSDAKSISCNSIFERRSDHNRDFLPRANAKEKEVTRISYTYFYYERSCTSRDRFLFF